MKILNYRSIYLIILCSITVLSCTTITAETEKLALAKLNDRAAVQLPAENMEKGRTYLSVYSHIYTNSQHRIHELTSTISLRNVNPEDTIYISKADFYNTEGKLIKHYLDHPIFIAPMETFEMIIEETDNSGGSGANFIFDWVKNQASADPLFEGVMISTMGQQGLSFTTQGKRIDGYGR